MSEWPDHPHFTGLNAPLGCEYDIADLEVVGTIPPEVEGTFFRAVPDPGFPPRGFDTAAVLSGDGMVSAIRFAGGKASTAMRYVETARRRAEREAGRALFGKYRNKYTDDPSVAGIDRTVANTTPVWHAGKLLMAKEDGRGYRIDPHSLATLGSHDFDGALRSETMTAHVRVDGETGELFFYGYEADGLGSTKVAYCIADRDGRLIREQWFDVPYCAMMHDFAISERYALFPVYPTICDPERVKAGGDHWNHEQERESWLGVMPRYGDVSEMKWFRGPPGVFAFHLMNAFETPDGLLHLDHCLSHSNAFPFIREASGIDIPQHALGGALTRWTVDPSADSGEVAASVIGPPGDFPVIPAARQGRPVDHAWMLTMNPEMRGPPLMGGPIAAMFNLLLRLDMRGGAPQALALGAGEGFNEPVHVPSDEPGHEGWLIMVVDRQTGPDAFEHECWIVDAGNLAAGAVAKVRIPARLRPQIHGWWVSAAQLANPA